MENTCSNCNKGKSQLECGSCSVVLCGRCAELLSDDHVNYFSQKLNTEFPSVYCRPCYLEKIEPQILAYEELLERARNIRVYFKNQSQETRLIRRKARPVKVVDSPDYHEAILTLAFLAAETGHNAVVDLTLASRKVRNGRHQTTLWSGSALPVDLDAKRLAREIPTASNPN